MPDQVKHRAHRQDMDVADDDWQPVMVPRSIKPLVPMSPERVQHLKEHLTEALRAMHDRSTSTSSPKPPPDGFTARVVQTACTLCRGWCCRNGADDAFLDDRTMARASGERPELNADGLLELYLERVPEIVFENSCVFHGKQGCTLSHALRSDVCNAYFCGGLLAFIADSDPPAATRIFAGEGDTLRTSAILSP